MPRHPAAHNHPLIRSQLTASLTEVWCHVIDTPFRCRRGRARAAFVPAATLGRGAGLSLGLGTRFNITVLPAALQPYYGSRHPAGIGVFVVLRPSLNPMKSMPAMPADEPMK